MKAAAEKAERMAAVVEIPAVVENREKIVEEVVPAEEKKVSLRMDQEE